MTLSIRYIRPGNETSELIEEVVFTFDNSGSESETFIFASAVAEFGLLLRQSEYKYNASFDHIVERATLALGTDDEGYRDEFLDLVEIAKLLSE